MDNIKMAIGTPEEPGLLTTRVFNLEYNEEQEELMSLIYGHILAQEDGVTFTIIPIKNEADDCESTSL